MTEPSRHVLIVEDETPLRQAIAEDVVVIYFSGHGSADSPDSRENLFLLPYDTDYDSIANTGFPIWDI